MRPFESVRDELVSVTQKTPFSLVKRGKSLAMHNHEDPCSIAPVEYEHLLTFVEKHKLKCGFEVATAFGVSALAIGLGMKEHGGRLVSMDAYIEEQHDGCMKYSPANKNTYQNSDGFKTASFLLKEHKLEDTVKLVVGYSPTDTKRVVEGMFGQGKLDFVFIDALHLDVAVLRDAEAVIPHLAKEHVVFFHDLHCFSDQTKEKLSKMLGGKLQLVPGCQHPGDGFNLGVINNL